MTRMRSGGGGGRIALYCKASEHTNTFEGFGGVPLLQAQGGNDGGSTDRKGGAGTVYAECGDADRLLVIDSSMYNVEGETSKRTTTLVDEGISYFTFGHLRVLGGARLRF